MGPLWELLAIDQRQALECFVLRLQDVAEPTVDREERLYNASHFVSDTTLGASFFNRAAVQERSLHKARLLDAIARRLELWRQRHAQLSRELRDQPYLLTRPMPPAPVRSTQSRSSGVDIHEDQTAARPHPHPAP